MLFSPVIFGFVISFSIIPQKLSASVPLHVQTLQKLPISVTNISKNTRSSIAKTNPSFSVSTNFSTQRISKAESVTRPRIIKQKLLLVNQTVAYGIYHYPSVNHCSVASHLTVLLLSSALNFEQRQAVRETWALPSRLRTFNTRLIFILAGFPVNFTNSVDRTRLEDETREHGDLLVTDLPELYIKLYLKTAVGLRWMSENCVTPFYIKTDDNMFVSFEAVQKVLRRINPNRLTIHGLRTQPSAVERDGKWGLSQSDYSGHWYPAYCVGGLQIYTRPALSRIVANFGRVPTIPIEDVWVTGFVAQYANVTRIDAEGAFWQGYKSEPHPGNVGRQLSYHRVQMNPRLMRRWWAKYELFLQNNDLD